MTPDEAITNLEQMQKQIIHGSNVFGETAQIIKEAKDLIQHFGWTSCERSDVVTNAERWLQGKRPLNT